MFSKRYTKTLSTNFPNVPSYLTKKYYTTTRAEKSIQTLVKNNFVWAGEGNLANV